jgi:O-antigen/teichoic acid export membrane protein
VVPVVIRLTSVAMIGGGLLVALLSREIVAALASPSYGGAAMFLPLVAGAMVVKGIYAFPYLSVWYRQRTAWVPALTAVTMAFSVGANVVLVPRWGAVASAVVLLLSYILLFSLMYVAGQRSVPTEYPWRKLAIVAGAALVAAMIGAPLPVSLAATTFKIALFAAFVAIVFVTGGVSAAEVQLLLRGDLGSRRTMAEA